MCGGGPRWERARMASNRPLVYDGAVRVALVSPYSYTYPGGVGQHVESLAEELLRQGHDARLLAPCDPDDRFARVLHRGARPRPRPLPDYLIPLGRTLGVPMNGAVSNLPYGPNTISVLGHELRTGGYDVVHIHEPNAPVASWYAAENAPMPSVATFHTYSTGRLSTGLPATFFRARRFYNKLAARIAVSEAAAWTAQRFYGGRYRVVPHGVDLDAAQPAERRPGGPLNLLFVGRAEERKGLPILLRAFEALRGAGVEARLTVAGAAEADVEPLLLDHEGVEIAGHVSEDEKWDLLGRADLLVAPSLGGESFGMVLTEAFASSTPVVASNIAGYRDVVRDGVDGELVPMGDAAALGEHLRSLALDPQRRGRMAAAARESAKRFAWPRVASEVVEVYEEAAAVPEPEGRASRFAARAGVVPAQPGERGPPRRGAPPAVGAPRGVPPRRAGRAGAAAPAALARAGGAWGEPPQGRAQAEARA